MGRRAIPETILSAEDFVEFFYQADVGLAILDDQLRYLAINRYLARVHGASAESHLGKRLQDVVGGLTPQLEPAYKQVIASGCPVPKVNVKGAVSAKTVSGHWMDNLFPLKDAKGRVKQVCAVVADVAESNASGNVETGTEGVLRSWKEISQYTRACIKTVQRWEQRHGFPIRRLKASKGAVVFAMKTEVDRWLQEHPPTKDRAITDGLFRSLFMASPLPTLIVGPERMIIDANLSMATLLRTNRKDLVGTRLANICKPEISISGQTPSSCVQEICCKDGTVFLAEYTLERLGGGLHSISIGDVRAQPAA